MAQSAYRFACLTCLTSSALGARKNILFFASVLLCSFSAKCLTSMTEIKVLPEPVHRKLFEAVLGDNEGGNTNKYCASGLDSHANPALVTIASKVLAILEGHKCSTSIHLCS